MTQETLAADWLSIPGFRDYIISLEGRVRCLARRDIVGRLRQEKEIRPSTKMCRVTLRRAEDDTVHKFAVGHLMLMTFVRLPTTGEVARHLNDHPWDNALTNLAWGTKKDNMHDSIRNGMQGKGSPTARKISDALRGRERNEIYRANMAKAKTGKPWTPRQRAAWDRYIKRRKSVTPDKLQHPEIVS